MFRLGQKKMIRITLFILLFLIFCCWNKPFTWYQWQLCHCQTGLQVLFINIVSIVTARICEKSLFLLAGLWYSLQTGPQVQTQHNVCSPTPAELQRYSHFWAPCCWVYCCDLRVLQTEGWDELVLTSNSFTDSFYTLQMCSLDAVAWASPYRQS